LGVYRYGTDAAAVIGLSVVTAMVTEAICQKIMRRPVTVADGSAALSGLVLALLLPANVPWFMIVVACATGIAIGKQCFGGRGANPLNPALVGWATLRITEPWSGYLDFDLMLVIYEVGFVKEYPQAVMNALGLQAMSHFDPWNLFMGRQTGGIGATQIFALLIGGVYLVLRGAVRWQIPLFFLFGVGVTAQIMQSANPAVYASPLFHLVTGNIMIGAFFLSTEPGSSPNNGASLGLYGLGCGVLTILFRCWSNYADGVVFACLLMSLFVPLLDRLKKRQVVPQPMPREGATI
jgi:Na+-translocating ferredoxin:NAD+ oxidoreductase subunit D